MDQVFWTVHDVLQVEVVSRAHHWKFRCHLRVHLESHVVELVLHAAPALRLAQSFPAHSIRILIEPTNEHSFSS